MGADNRSAAPVKAAILVLLLLLSFLLLFDFLFPSLFCYYHYYCCYYYYCLIFNSFMCPTAWLYYKHKTDICVTVDVYTQTPWMNRCDCLSFACMCERGICDSRPMKFESPPGDLCFGNAAYAFQLLCYVGIDLKLLQYRPLHNGAVYHAGPFYAFPLLWKR